MINSIELRCPAPAQAGRTPTLFGKIDRNEAVVEVACQDCKRDARKLYPDLLHVLHSFNILTGKLESTSWTWRNGKVTRPHFVPIHAV